MISALLSELVISSTNQYRLIKPTPTISLNSDCRYQKQGHLPFAIYGGKATPKNPKIDICGSFSKPALMQLCKLSIGGSAYGISSLPGVLKVICKNRNHCLSVR